MSKDAYLVIVYAGLKMFLGIEQYFSNDSQKCENYNFFWFKKASKLN